MNRRERRREARESRKQDARKLRRKREEDAADVKIVVNKETRGAMRLPVIHVTEPGVDPLATMLPDEYAADFFAGVMQLAKSVAFINDRPPGGTCLQRVLVACGLICRVGSGPYDVVTFCDAGPILSSPGGGGNETIKPFADSDFRA